MLKCIKLIDYSLAKMEEEYYTIVDNFPIPNIKFLDFQKTFNNPKLFQQINMLMFNKFKEINEKYKIDSIGVIDGRGLIYGCILTFLTGCPWFPIRKLGKLPPPKITSEEYFTEYATKPEILECSENIVNGNILLVDDILATGNTLNTAYNLLSKSKKNNVIGALTLLEINDIPRKMLMNTYSII